MIELVKSTTIAIFGLVQRAFCRKLAKTFASGALFYGKVTQHDFNGEATANLTEFQ